jgi:L-threonylcarbamoyladenylate synthase
MKTEEIKNEIARAAELIRCGGLVAVPTETVYGLAGNGLDAAAVQRIYDVKGRPARKAMSLLVPGAEAMAAYCEDVPPAAEALAAAYWPGPLTIVLRAKPLVPAIVRAGGPTVGLRCPDHPLTHALLRETGLPLAAPSANPSGAPSPKTAEAVLDYFDGKIDAVLDGGPCGIGTESTIIDLSQTPYRILRQGALPEAEILRTLRGRMLVIGITGGSGCGKTTALDVLRTRGALVIDCDEVYHELTRSCAELRAELETRFGALYDGAALDRKKLGRIVFADPAALRDLNRITHKYVDREIDRRLDEHALRGGTLAAIDAIALLESGGARRARLTVAVTAPTEARIARIMARDGIGEDYARARVAAQKPNEYFAEHCDRTLVNDGTPAEFERKCQKFFTEVLKRYGNES